MVTAHEKIGFEFANVEVKSVPVSIAKPDKVELSRIED
jgi:hypothetical protein